MGRSLKVIIVVVILGLLYTSLPYFFGFATKRYVNAYSAHENKLLTKRFGVRLQFEDYKRGWFGSSADLLIQKKIGEQFQTLRKLPVKITHGPIYRIDGKFYAGLGNVSSRIVATPQLPYSMRFEEHIAFNGEHTVLLLLLPKSVHDKHGPLYFDQVKISGKSSLKADHFEIVLTADGLQVKDPLSSHTAKLDALVVRVNAQEAKNKNWQSVVGMNMKGLNFSFPLQSTHQSGRFTLDNLSLQNLSFDTKTLQGLLMQAMTLRKEFLANEQHPNPAAWIPLAKKTLSSMVTARTALDVDGLSVKTPYGGVFLKKYHVSFPALKENHTPFDVFSYMVSSLDLSVPFLHIPLPDSKQVFHLNNLKMTTEANTIFSQEGNISIDGMSVNHSGVKPDQAAFHAGPFEYQGNVTGNTQKISQKFKWTLGQLCVTGDCFHQIQMHLDFDNMNYQALAKLTDAADNLLVQQANKHQNPEALIGQTMAMMNDYLKLFTKETKLTLGFEMQSPKGKVKLDGHLAWPTLGENPTAHDFVQNSHYQLNLVVPSEYVDEFLAHADHQQAVQHKAADDSDSSAAAHVGTHTSQEHHDSDNSSARLLHYAIQNNYIVKKDGVYVLNLSGQGTKVMMNGKLWQSPPVHHKVAPAESAEPESVATPASTATPASSHELHPMQTAPVSE